MTALQKFTKRCYASQHLHPQEFGVYEVCLRLTSGGKKTLYFDGRKMAARFTGFSKTSMYRAVAELVASGWLLPLKGLAQRRSGRSGRYAATEFTVLTHEQWTAKHGSKRCTADDSPVPSTGLESNSPAPSTGTVQSQVRELPVPSTGITSPASGTQLCSEPSSVEESLLRDSFVGAAPPACLEGTQKAGVECDSTPSVAPVPSTGMDVHCALSDELAKRFTTYCAKVQNG